MTTERIVIKTVDDSIIEDDEIFVVTLSTTNLDVQIDTFKGTTTVTIIDNDSKCVFELIGGIMPHVLK